MKKIKFLSFFILQIYIYLIFFQVHHSHFGNCCNKVKYSLYESHKTETCGICTALLKCNAGEFFHPLEDLKEFSSNRINNFNLYSASLLSIFNDIARSPPFIF